ncbi:glycoside hydrolase [Vararia minispora EC-137]|uniref:Glycoside hydrolase n=1 Tax=Vararia minispora EC-137 TaxID=1314806 RepID=A0ACB8QTA0_9AGAM|nr:glycoside hydrolase [Vararia minispora EC-137]
MELIPREQQTCTTPGSCTTSSNTVVLDANWRWTHNVSGFTNCYTGGTLWDSSLCSNDGTCAGTYGITTSGGALILNFNVGSRGYLMDPTDTKYRLFNLKNKEFAFDIDISTLPCSLNGALYFVNVDADGGAARLPTNKAGAEYGTGYYDSQCPQDLKSISGKANSQGWVPSSNNVDTGTGNEHWEANTMAAAYTPHVCTVAQQTAYQGSAQCGNTTGTRATGICDEDGCDFNSFRLGSKSFLGPPLTVGMTRPFTVVTQFMTPDNTANSQLTVIRHIYKQNGIVIQQPSTSMPGMASFSSIMYAFCNAQKTAFGDADSFQQHGGRTICTDTRTGMVLVMSLWDDYAVDMLWLDSTYPPTKATTAPGVARGNCSTSTGSPNAQVIFSNIKFGALNSTY